ncbi:MAG: ECF transporter S component [Ruminococcus sp.]|nr:ECF transporter S component [Ruminococcus sp.]MCD7773753.1 ECF transporter S component [Ruminococcus sp.]
MSNNTLTANKPRLSIKAQVLYTIGAIIAAVALPQIFHLIGAASGAGTAPGETFLPMHLPIILVGLLAGPYVGAIAGLLGPVASFALSGMPTAVMLPFMMIELCIYGLSAGLLRNVKMPSLVKVLISQVAGRAVRALAIVVAIYLFNNTNVHVQTIWNSIVAGLPGLVIQWALIPLIAFRVDSIKKNEQ